MMTLPHSWLPVALLLWCTDLIVPPVLQGVRSGLHGLELESPPEAELQNVTCESLTEAGFATGLGRLSPQQQEASLVFASLPRAGDVQTEGTEKNSPLLLTNQAEITGRVSYDAGESRVYVEWVYKVAGLTDGVLVSDPTKASSSQEIALDYWPTEVVSAGPLRIAVAGVSPYGFVVVQTIRFKEVGTLPAASIDIVTGKVVVPRLRLRIDRIKTVLRLPTTGARRIGHMWANRGRVGSLFLQLQDTRDIYELDLDTTPIPPMRQIAVKLGHADPAAGVMIVSGLDRYYSAANDGTHVSKGHLYWLYSPNSSNKEILMFEDTDQDGEIDLAQVLSSWPTEYAQHTNYTSMR